MKPVIYFCSIRLVWTVKFGKAIVYSCDTEAQAQAWLEGRL